ncbi:MAG: hypothetical protein U5Q44_11285 [Dehalococcoidia bacterium]|nr:hypothetical protein [Dehalococcoidia bacterium]
MERAAQRAGPGLSVQHVGFMKNRIGCLAIAERLQHAVVTVDAREQRLGDVTNPQRSFFDAAGDGLNVELG